MKIDLLTQFSLVGIPEPEREYRFVQGRRFAFDFAWPDLRIAAEQEGGLYGKGKRCPTCGRNQAAGHSSVERLLTDLEKYNEALLRGWLLVRFTPQMADSGAALTLIERAFSVRKS